jgi:hypothetical protein
VVSTPEMSIAWMMGIPHTHVTQLRIRTFRRVFWRGWAGSGRTYTYIGVLAQNLTIVLLEGFS